MLFKFKKAARDFHLVRLCLRLPKTRNILTEHLRTGRSIGGQFPPPHQSVTAEKSLALPSLTPGLLPRETRGPLSVHGPLNGSVFTEQKQNK